MFAKLVKVVIGSRNDRLIKKKKRIVKKINALEAEFHALSDAELRAKTAEFRGRLAQGESLEELLPEAFATVREAGLRTVNMRHFDVQLIGGMILDDGKIAEMKTGEGKTLVATLAVYLNALPARGVHVVTVNDYLARRDAAWMGKIYEFLGMTVGVIVSELSPDQRRVAYAADITYGTNNEFGFDYLRDNMAFNAAQKVQRELHYAIVDEVDSILIDEARTPLIISGPTEDHSDLYKHLNAIVPLLTKQQEKEGPGDYHVDEKARQVYLTEEGHEKIENLMVEHNLMAEGESLYSAANILLMHYTNASLRAHVLFQKDVDYIVLNNEVVIVDEFTGRVMPGRRWSEGLHQAVEAKEGVRIQNENQTLASITFQNYFRLYHKLAGMTGTADTEAFEFQQIYHLEVIVIPTHKPMIRDDMGDLVYLTTEEKYKAICEDIKDCVERGQPVLVGTTSIENSEHVSELLKKQKIPHQILNAKQHEREAHIIAQAGRPGTVTIATNMAGRGTDIVLGGNLEAELEQIDPAETAAIEKARDDWTVRHNAVIESGGLHVIGSERHESRRIDNQLRGRSGRQGDPGSTRFYLSLQDNLMRIFASERVAGLMQKLGLEEGEAIEHPWVTKAIENAQRKVEGRNFDIRKQLLEFDNVANDQRREVYKQRNELMEADEISETIAAIRQDVVNLMIDQHIPKRTMEEQWNLRGLEEALESEVGAVIPIRKILDEDDSMHEETLRETILEKLDRSYAEKEALVGPELMHHFEKSVMLQVLDNSWKEHLAAMDHLRQGIHLRGYAQKDPKQEYKREAFQMFVSLLDGIKQEVTGILCRVQVRTEEDLKPVESPRISVDQLSYEHAEVQSSLADPEMPDNSVETQKPIKRAGPKIGRNEPCPCGSGKKYKQCHGKLN
ncbi:MAG: preprotein translocase subunit SecA [Methylococcaceae bacterium]|nr:preprotein translocase subunit SecA [Methylococcaceae bacterium]MCI0732848.1 preprotein translocase subunit SecA [Methylococcaceae bacterium]